MYLFQHMSILIQCFDWLLLECIYIGNLNMVIKPSDWSIHVYHFRMGNMSFCVVLVLVCDHSLQIVLLHKTIKFIKDGIIQNVYRIYLYVFNNLKILYLIYFKV